MRGCFGDYSRIESTVYTCILCSRKSRFLNAHQDYKGLPVVPIALNLRTYVFAVQELKDCFKIASLNLKSYGHVYVDEFQIDKLELKSGKCCAYLYCFLL
ncbi:MAG: hypothetical protein J7K82_08645 [Thermoproteales archaeon]|nr:hypothetical protein [Thermoproteales archaeon]